MNLVVLCRLGFVDFEDACIGPSIIDVACCLVGNCFEVNDDSSIAFNAELMKAFIGGYVKALKEKGSFEENVAKEFQLLPNVLTTALMLNARYGKIPDIFFKFFYSL